MTGGDVRKLNPVAVVQAEVKAHPNSYSGEDGLYDETVRQLATCKQKPGSCPVLKPYYRDLTGDGKDELIVGIRMPDQQLAVRCYMPAKDGGLIRIMSTVDQIISVDLAGRDVILRSVSAGMPGYEYRTAWSWDDHQQAMLPTRDEIVRRKPGGETPGGEASRTVRRRAALAVAEEEAADGEPVGHPARRTHHETPPDTEAAPHAAAPPGRRRSPGSPRCSSP